MKQHVFACLRRRHIVFVCVTDDVPFTYVVSFVLDRDFIPDFAIVGSSQYTTLRQTITDFVRDDVFYEFDTNEKPVVKEMIFR